MREHRINSFGALHTVLQRFKKSNKWVFRGHVDPSWELLPKAGRLPYSDSDDLNILDSWKRRAVEFLNSVPDNDWDWIAIAQHHGLATRLLDWSYNPLIAAYFASTHEHDTDAHIYCYKPNWYLIAEKTKPKTYKGVSLFKPKGVVPRITRQGGVFTVHSDPTIPLNKSLDKKDELELIIISKSYVRDLLFDLNHYGINSANVFPDLDGLSKHVNWYSENRNFWDGGLGEDET